MSSRGDAPVFALAAVCTAAILAWDLVDERERRVAAEEQLQQIEQAQERPCDYREGALFVSSLGWDGSEWARWCGYYRTVIETVRIEWEKAR